MRYISTFFLFYLAFFSKIYSNEPAISSNPAIEIRAAWLTTNWKLDWPKSKSVEEQKKELDDILDELQRNKFNVVLFQARAQGKTFYRSTLEAVSPHFNSSEGFDPLAYVIEACHARQMECHAWITTFPMERVKKSKRGAIIEKRPNNYKATNGWWYLDPGAPETEEKLVLIAKEIVTKYDIDGLHLDYIRYPENSKRFQDNDTYKKYGKGKNKDLWRRENVNKVVFSIYDTVKALKKWVQVSSAPIGKYRMINNFDGWTAYESVHQDAGYWMQQGKHDILFPMMYSNGKDFYPHVEEWLKTSNNRPIVPGLAAYKLEEKEKNWQAEEISNQMQFTRNKGASGHAFFRTEQVIKNKKGLKNSIQQFYKYPAKLPPLTWLEDKKPSQPRDFKVYKDKKGFLIFEWDSPTKEDKYTYNIYFATVDKLDPNAASNLLVTNLHDNRYAIPADVGEYGLFYFVTASDRFHNEGDSAESVFFVHSEDIY